LQQIALGAGICTPVAYKRLAGYVEEYCRTSVSCSCSREVDELTGEDEGLEQVWGESGFLSF